MRIASHATGEFLLIGHSMPVLVIISDGDSGMRHTLMESGIVSKITGAGHLLPLELAEKIRAFTGALQQHAVPAQHFEEEDYYVNN